MLLEDNECVWDECKNFKVTSSGPECLECEDKWGLGIDSFCYRCPSHRDWASCSSCSINKDFVPADCMSCGDDKILVLNDKGKLPPHKCQFWPIDHCHKMNKDVNACDQCDSNYVLSTDKSKCVPCDISMCSECEIKSAVNSTGESVEYKSCTKC